MIPTKQIIHHRHHLAQLVRKRGKRGDKYKTRKSTSSEKVIIPKLLHADYYYNCIKYLPHITLPLWHNICAFHHNKAFVI